MGLCCDQLKNCPISLSVYCDGNFVLRVIYSTIELLGLCVSFNQNPPLGCGASFVANRQALAEETINVTLIMIWVWKTYWVLIQPHFHGRAVTATFFSAVKWQIQPWLGHGDYILERLKWVSAYAWKLYTKQTIITLKWQQVSIIAIHASTTTQEWRDL